MFLKQYNYKPRSNSTSSSNAEPMDKSTNEPASPTQSKATTAGATQTAAQAGRRRSSLDQQYNGLNAYKRKSSSDEAATARKASWADQKQQPGVLGQMWNKFTTGN